MPSKKDELPVEFPARGMDVSCPYGQQPPMTTPVGINVRVQDPFLQRTRGGARTGLQKYGDIVPGGVSVIQMLEQLTDPQYQNLATVFEDYQTDSVDDESTNNGGITRNPGRLTIWGRKIPPRGSGAQPNRTQPEQVRRRVQLVANHATRLNGESLILTATVTQVDTGFPVNAAVVVLTTNPVGQDGYGEDETTLLDGECTFTVSEPTFNGDIVYFASHTYIPGGAAYPTTVRGIVTVEWQPNESIILTSPHGTSLPADGKSHPLFATLINNPTNLPVGGKMLKLNTDPVGYPGDATRNITGGGGGVALFTVSSDMGGVVDYQAVKPRLNVPISNVVTITWTSESCTGNIDSQEPTLVVDSEVDVIVGWYVTWDEIFNFGTPEETTVTHIKMVMVLGDTWFYNCGNVVPESGPLPGIPAFPNPADYDEADVDCSTQSITGAGDIEQILADMQPEYEAFLAQVQNNQCV